MNIADVMFNYPLLASISASLLSQVIKVIIASIKNKRLRLDRFIQTGGMPSSHSAMAVALMVSIALQEGIKSVFFAISVSFALVVLYDAGGIRRYAGMQAQMINQIRKNLELKEMGDNESNDDKLLKELIGHTPVEVVGGSIIGVIIALILGYYYV